MCLSVWVSLWSRQASGAARVILAAATRALQWNSDVYSSKKLHDKFLSSSPPDAKVLRHRTRFPDWVRAIYFMYGSILACMELTIAQYRRTGICSCACVLSSRIDRIFPLHTASLFVYLLRLRCFASSQEEGGKRSASMGTEAAAVMETADNRDRERSTKITLVTLNSSAVRSSSSGNKTRKSIKALYAL